MIPKKIHYCWFGPNELSDVAVKCIESWSKFAPDYEIKLWTEENSPMDEPYVRGTHKSKQYSFMSDFVRAWALYTEGGIYLDVDVELLKSPDELLQNEAFSGFQEPHLNGRHSVACGVMGGVKGHKFFSDWIDDCRHVNKTSVKLKPGPLICTDILKTYGLSEYGDQVLNGVRLYKTKAFYPYFLDEEFHPDCITDETFSVHYWSNDWGPGSKMSKWEKLRYKTSRLLEMALGKA